MQQEYRWPGVEESARTPIGSNGSEFGEIASTCTGREQANNAPPMQQNALSSSRAFVYRQCAQRWQCCPVMKPVYKPAIYFFPLLGCLRQQTIINNGGWQHVLAPHRITPIHVEDNRPAGWCKNSAALAACTLGVHCASTRAASDYTQADAASGCRL